MPFPNFHAARQKPSGLFSDKRTGKDKFGKGIDAIFDIRVQDGKRISEVQSIHFDKDDFTPAQAKKWLQDNDFKSSDFERATGTKKPVAKCYESESPSRVHARFKIEDGSVILTDLDINLRPGDVTEDIISQFSKLGTTLAQKKPTSAKKASHNVDMRVLKMNKPEQIVFGVVMEPEVVDGEGEVTSATEIRKAAHNYLKNHRLIKREHVDDTECVPVESYIAPEDFTMNKENVIKGAWLMGIHVPDKQLWKQVENHELNAFSVGGTAQRAVA